MTDNTTNLAHEVLADGAIETGPAIEPGQSDLIAPEALAALLQRYNLPEPRSTEPFAGGGDSILVNGELIVRVNRRDPHLPTFAKAALVYRRLRRSTDVPCPKVLALDTSHDLAPYDVLILSHVDGTNGATVWESLDEDAREKLSEEAGRMFGTIHGLQWATYGDYNRATGMFGEEPRWTDILLRRLQVAAEAALATGALPQTLIDAVVTELNDADSVLDTASVPTLVHGDLKLANLLLKQQDNAWHIAAILDWDRSWTADAAFEFASLSGSGQALIGDAFVYGYRERHPIQNDLRSRVHLYRLLLQLEGAVAQKRNATDPSSRQSHEMALRRLLRRG